MKKTLRLGLTAVLATALGGSAIAAASPTRPDQEEGAVTATGVCSAASTWALSAKPDIGIEAEANLETGVADQEWNLVLAYNHNVILSGQFTTEDDGGFEVITQPGNRNVVPDRLELRATNQTTGETCRGGLIGDF